MYLLILLCFPNLLRLRSQIWKRVTFALFVRISAMQINGFFQIVTDVTSVGFNLFSCIALFGFVSFAFLLFILLCSLECAGVFRPCGSDHGLCPLDSHKPLKRLDRNFKCLGLLGTNDRGGLLSSDLRQT